MPLLDELLCLFRYPARSGRALLGGTSPLRYCGAKFACVIPTWRLPDGGHAAALVTGGGNKKTPAHLSFRGVSVTSVEEIGYFR